VDVHLKALGLETGLDAAKLAKAAGMARRLRSGDGEAG
jgi:hypothetical protein